LFFSPPPPPPPSPGKDFVAPSPYLKGNVNAVLAFPFQLLGFGVLLFRPLLLFQGLYGYLFFFNYLSWVRRDPLPPGPVRSPPPHGHGVGSEESSFRLRCRCGVTSSSEGIRRLFHPWSPVSQDTPFLKVTGGSVLSSRCTFKKYFRMHSLGGSQA